MSYPRKIIKESSISFTGMIFGQTARYLFIALISRWAGVIYVGLYSLASSVTNIISTFGKAGLDVGILRFVGMNEGTMGKETIENDIGSALKMGLIFSFMAMVLQLLLAHYLTETVFKENPLLTTVLYVNALTIPLSAFTIIAAHATQGFKLLKYKTIVLRMLIPGGLLVGFVAARFFPFMELMIILPTVVSAVIGFIGIIYFLRRLSQFRLYRIFSFPISIELLKFSYPLMLVSTLSTTMHWADVTLLGYFLDSKAVGLYHPAARTATLLRSVMLSFVSIFGPLLANLWRINRHDKMVSMYKLVTRWIITITLPMGGVIILFPKKFMLLFGPDFISSFNILSIMTIAALVQSWLGVGATVLSMSGYTRINLGNTTLTLIFHVGLNCILIPRIGLTGAAITTLTSMLLLNILRLVELKHLLSMHPFSRKMVKPFIAGMIMLIVLILIRPLIIPWHTLATLSVAAFVGLVVYFTALFYLGFDEDDHEVMGMVFRLKSKTIGKLTNAK